MLTLPVPVGSTSMHGVPRIINARSLPARVFWSVICVGAFGMFFWQSGILLDKYFSYPKKVNMEVVQQPVQVCSARSAVRSAVKASM